MGDALAFISEWKSPDFQKQPLAELVLLIALYAVVPAALGLVVAAVMLRYPLDATRVAEIQRQLAERQPVPQPPAPEPDPNVALLTPAD